MRAVDAKFEVLQRRAFDSHHMHVNAEKIAVHRQRIADTALAIQRIARRQRMQDRPVLTHGLLACRHQNLAQIACFHFLAAEIDARGVDIARQAAGGNIDDQAVDGQARHALSRID